MPIKHSDQYPTRQAASSVVQGSSARQLGKRTLALLVAVGKSMPLRSALLLMAGLGLVVYWLQLTSLAWFGQLLVFVATVAWAFSLAWVLSRASLELQLVQALSNSGQALPAVNGGSRSVASQFAQSLAQSKQEADRLAEQLFIEKSRLLALQNCIDGFVMELRVDQSGAVRVLAVDDSIESYLPVKRADVILNWACLVSVIEPRQAAMFSAIIGRSQAFPQRESLVLSVLAAPGSTQSVFLNLTVVRSLADSGEVALHAVFQDISELVQARQNAENADRAKSEFLATISHELRTPLNAIIGFSNLLAEQLSDPVQKADAVNIASAAQGLHLIVSDVLEYSRIQANGLRLDKSSFRLDDLLSSTFALNRLAAQQKGLDYQFAYEGAKPLWVVGDENRLRQVVQNLLSNAIKFTQDGYVRLSLQVRPSSGNSVQVYLEVADSGMGISQVSLRKLFRHFSQADRQINRQYGGTGLGLAISKGLVELMGGQIDVRSEPGVGSVFTVMLHLPLGQAIQPQAGPATEAAGASAAPASRSLSVLVVDDHPLNIKVLDRFLSKKGHQVDKAEGGLQAVDKASKSRYDLILMDIDMPDLDGHEATKRIRNHPQQAAASASSVICALSGLTDDDNIAKSKKAGLDLHLTKPVSFEQLDKLLLAIVNEQPVHSLATDLQP